MKKKTANEKKGFGVTEFFHNKYNENLFCSLTSTCIGEKFDWYSIGYECLQQHRQK